MRKMSGSATSGFAGEYFVAAELAKMGHIALITLRNTEAVDIVATNEKKKAVLIQVKTQQGNGHKWPLTFKAEKSKSNFFYVFVTLKGRGERPEYYIVPSRVVAKSIAKNHRKWLKTPGRDGRAHKDNPMRIFVDYKAWSEKWDILGL